MTEIQTAAARPPAATALATSLHTAGKTGSAGPWAG
jgi:hypothetical protein